MRALLLIVNSLICAYGMCQTFPEYSFDKNQLTISLNTDDTLTYELKVYRKFLQIEELTEVSPILGEIKKLDNIITFTPIIPFSIDNAYTT